MAFSFPSSLRPGFLSLIAAVLGTSQALAIDTVVTFNEVHYHPADGAVGPEFVEFFNQNSVHTDLSGWRISGGIDFAFPKGTVIAGGGYLVVAANPGALAAAGGPAGALGPFTGTLDNGGETLRLRNNNDRVMDELAYNDRKPWPVGPDGSGASLSKIAPLKHSDLAENWTHSLATGGTPGAVNFGGPAGSPGGNIALGKTVIDGSSAYNGQPFNVGTFTAQNVTDGSVSDVFGVSYWLGTQSVPNQYFTLDLGQSYALSEIRLRNTHNTQFNDRGTLGFRMFASSSVNGSNQLVAPQQILSGTLARVDGQDPITAEIFNSVSGLTATTARYLKFESLTAVNNHAGLNEIEVYTAAGPPVAVPEDLPLWINEVAGTADASFWVEIYNAGGSAINLEGFVLTFEDAGEYTFPAGTSIAAGGRLVVSAATLALPLAPLDGENLYLYQPGKVALLDAVRIDDLAIGRVPDGSANLFTIGRPAEKTPGTANVVSIPDAVVINEIMYHHRPQYAEAGDPPAVTTKAAFGWNGSWRYNEAGDDLGANWANSAHPTGLNWKSGVGPLGYETTVGHPPEPIVTQLTNPTLNTPRVITYYFETEFVVAAADLPHITALKFSHETDDGAIYYLNGQELSPRYDMPSGPVTASTLAVNLTATDANAIRFFSVAPTFLVAGSNRISVEVHQSAVNSSDVVMGLKLDLELTAPGPKPPVAYAENPEEWVELYNRSGSPVDLGGWELDRAVRYRFPAGTPLPAGGYLVVARNLTAFRAKHPGVLAVGNYAGSLSNSGERLLLLDPFNNPADEVAYFDDKPWPSAADGGGSSLELRHPGIDNSLPASWAASDNSASSSWRNYQYTLTAKDQLSWNSPPTNGFHELRLGLFEEGEVLIDDFSVVEAPGGANLELIANGSFETTTGWRLLGTHQDSRVFNDGTGNALRLVATDSFNYLNNLIESNLTSGGALRPVQNGTDYRVSFRAKWLSGSPQLRFELYYNKIAKLVVLDQPVAHGTPGARNSAYSTALGPDLAGLTHSPAVPTASQPITV